MIRKKGIKRKMKNVIQQNKMDIDDISNDDQSRNSKNKRKKRNENNDVRTSISRAKKFTGTTSKPEQGNNTIPYSDWKNLVEDKRSLIKDYNAQHKHGELADGFKWLEGVTIVKQSDRVE